MLIINGGGAEGKGGFAYSHTITSSIVGAGAARRFSSVRWGIAVEIALSWILTLPATIALGWTFALLFQILFP